MYLLPCIMYPAHFLSLVIVGHCTLVQPAPLSLSALARMDSMYVL